jgi:hypothetical protein
MIVLDAPNHVQRACILQQLVLEAQQTAGVPEGIVVFIGVMGWHNTQHLDMGVSEV